jgi:hypothetical protein
MDLMMEFRNEIKKQMSLLIPPRSNKIKITILPSVLYKYNFLSHQGEQISIDLRIPLPIRQKVAWAPELVWTTLRRENLAPVKTQTLSSRPSSLYTAPRGNNF